MKKTTRIFTAWLLALVMVLSIVPLDALAAIFTIREGNKIIDTSPSIQITDLDTVLEKNGVKVSTLDNTLPQGESANIVITMSAGTTSDELGSFSITVTGADGTWQPQGEKVYIAANFPADQELDYDGTSALSLIDSTGKDIPATFSKSTDGTKLTGVSFAATSLSSWTIVKTEAEQDVNARLYVHFMKGSEEIAVMSMTETQLNANQMNVNIYDPYLALETGEVFKGWTTTQAYTVGDAEDPNVRKDIDGIRAIVRQKLMDGVADGDQMYVYAMVYKSYHISYIDELNVTVFTDEALYRPNDTTVNYDIQFAYTPYYVTGSDEDDQTKAANFDGWGLTEDPEEEPVYQNGQTVNLAALNLEDTNDNLKLYAKVSYGHWLVFNANGSGATFTAPLFVGVDETPATTNRMPADPTRPGYTFVNWYYDAAGTELFDPTKEIKKTTDVFAKWDEDTETSFTVLIWQKRVGEADGYDFVRAIDISDATTGDVMAEVIEGNIGDSEITVNDESVFVPFPEGHKLEGQVCEGFTYEKCSTNKEDGKVTADGTSVLNVYFTRRHYTLKFYYAASIEVNNGTPTRPRYETEWYIAHNSDNGPWSWSTPSGSFVPSYNKEDGLPKDTDSVGDGRAPDGATYYYVSIWAEYGANISGSWPGYNDFNQGSSGSNYLNSWILMPGAMARKGDNPDESHGGDITIKGKITLMDEQLLGNLKASSGSGGGDGDGYVVAQYNNQPNYYTYFIYFKVPDGKEDEYSETREYPAGSGNKYYLFETVDVRSGSGYDKQHAPAYSGYEYKGEERNNVTGRTGREIYYFYEPLKYPILYMDGVYDRGNLQPLNKSSNTLKSLQDEDMVAFGADVSAYAIDPTSLIADGSEYVFIGWYPDSSCTGDKYTFDTMPIGGITVYAKWVRKEYTVNLHPRANGDTTFAYVNGNGAGEYAEHEGEPNSDTFWAHNGEKIGNVGGTRKEYDLIGWFTNEGLTKVWDFDAFIMNDTIVGKYGVLYALDGSDSRYNPNYPGTVGEINLYANWRKILSGADGIDVVYDAEETTSDGTVILGTDPPVDTNKYSDQAQAIAYPASKPPVAGEGETQLIFQYWIIQKWTVGDDGVGAYVDTDKKVYPGDRFTVNYEDAKMDVLGYENDGVTIKTATYTVQLHAHYGVADDALPTHIYWLNNYVEGDGAFVKKYDNLAINQTVPIPDAQERAGYIFLGWANRVERKSDNSIIYIYDVTEPDIVYDAVNDIYTSNSKTVTVAFADESKPYAAMYAVWLPKLKIRITGATGSETYNGTEQSVSGYKVEYKVADGQWTETAPDGVSVTLKTANTDVAKGTNVRTEPYPMGLTSEHFTISLEKDENDNVKYDFTAEEDLEIVDGSLTITKAPLTITAKDQTYTYNGSAQGPAGTYTSSIDTYVTADKLLGSDALTSITLTGSKTDAGEYTGEIVPSEAAIGDATSNYDITYAAGKLTIGKRNVTLTSESGSKTYDGTPLTKPDVTVGGDGFVEGEATDIKATGTVTYVSDGEVDNTITYTEGTNFNANNYNISKTEGKLQILAITDTIVITAASGEKMYDGTPLTNAGYTYTQNILAEGDELTAVVEGTITNYGTEQNVVTSYKVMRGSTEVTGNYTFGTSVNGTLEITKRNVTLTSGSGSKKYDGTELKNGEVTVTAGEGFIEGEGATYNVTGSQTLVGSSNNTFEYSLNNGTLADNYNITKAEGTLVVTDEDVSDSLVVTKTVDDTVYNQDEVITFTIKVTNIYADARTITLTEQEGVELEQAVFENVEPGTTITTTATHKVTAEDILLAAGLVEEIDSADGQEPVTGDSGEPAEELPKGYLNTVTASISSGKSWKAQATAKLAEPKPHLTLTKVTTSETPEGGYPVGSVITYDITIKNDSIMTIYDVTTVDEKTGDRWTEEVLEAGKSVTYTASYKVTEADVIVGEVVNVATAKGRVDDPDDPDVPADPVEKKDPTEKPNPLLTLVKETTSTPEGEDGKYVLGETIEYKITITNDGNLTISDITLTDTVTGYDAEDITKSLDKTELAPGETATATFTHEVTEKDILAGSVKNIATATGTDPGDDEVKPDPDDAEDPTEDPNPHLTLEKVTTSKPANGTKYVVGETITYSITVTNDGNLTLTDVVVTDDKTGEKWTIDALAPGESETFETKYVVTAADSAAGSVNNVATATGVSEDPDNPEVPADPDDVTDEVTMPVRLTVNYWIGTTAAAPSFTNTYDIGAEYNVTSPTILGYTPDQARVTGTITADTVLNVYYTVNTYNLTVNYVYVDGTQAAPSYTATVDFGTVYNVPSPAVDGFTPNNAVVTDTMPARDVIETVIYTAIPAPAPAGAGPIIIDDYDTPLGLPFLSMCSGDIYE